MGKNNRGRLVPAGITRQGLMHTSRSTATRRMRKKDVGGSSAAAASGLLCPNASSVYSVSKIVLCRCDKSSLVL